MTEPWRPADLNSESGALQKRVARGLTWTLIDTWGSQLVGLGVFVLLARLLLPVDFGLVALAAVFVFFAQLLVDQGLGDALIQRRTLTRSQIDTAFWVALATGALLTLAGLILAGPIATLLNEPRLELILQILSITFVLAALNSIQLALLRREMAFKSLAVRKLVTVAGAGAIGVAMALSGFGVWALVAQQLANAAISVLMLWRVSPWRPGRQGSRAEFRGLFSFGIHVMAGDVLNYLSRNMDNLLIGIFLGTTPLGFYAVAYRVLDTSQTLLVNGARKLAFPVFSRLQHDPARMVRAFSRVQRAVSVMILPGYIGLALVAEEAIVVIFGQRWADSGPVAAVLYLVGPVLTIQLFSGAMLNAVGHPEVTFRIRLVTSIVNVAGFLIAVAFFGTIIAVAAAFAVRAYIVMPLLVWWLRAYAGVPIRSHIADLRSAAMATAVMAGAIVVVKLVLGASVSSALLLLAEVVVAIPVYALSLILIDRKLVTEVATFFAQSFPGGEAIGRRLRLIPASAADGRRRGRGRGRGAERGKSPTGEPVGPATEDALPGDAMLGRESDV